MRDTHSLVAGLGDADMVWLLSIGKLRQLRAGETLVEAQRAINDLFFVIGGTLVVLLPDDTRVATLGEGQVIGEMSFINQRPPSVTVRADRRTELLCIPRQLIIDRFDREPVFAARFYRALAMALAERLRDTTAAIRPGHEEEGDHDAAGKTKERFRGLVGRIIGKSA